MVEDSLSIENINVITLQKNVRFSSSRSTRVKKMLIIHNYML